ncbi:MAG: SprT family zinc-dependent metalloprotease [Myxococcales bacterium FL481]|nr:MAG: SprT family zinc-dependent metalloprotease [Myxococcales bacterium FL481]
MTTAPYLAHDRGALEPPQDELARRLNAHLGHGRARVVFTDNVHTMLSVKRRGGEFVFRAHHLFADAPSPIVRAMVDYAERHDAAASERLRDFVDEHDAKIRTSKPRAMQARGQQHDLDAIFDELNEQYFQGTIAAQITWGARTRRSASFHSVRLGSYTVEDRLIRIHPVLDQPAVPRYFVAWIVYHEMLHQVHEMPIVDGRRVHHTKAFRRDEAKYEHYTAAVLWERAQLPHLLGG